MSEIEVHIPVAESRQQAYPLAARLRSLSGSRIGWLDNMKANANELLLEVTQSVQKNCSEQQFSVIAQSKNATSPAPESIIAHLKTCDAVVLAIADWGSCTSWSVHDAIVLEKAGIPTALVCTDEFGALARAESQVLGIDALPLIAIPHPLAGNSSALVSAKANAIAGEISSALTSSEHSLTERYQSKFLQLAERRLAGGAVCVDETCVIDPGMITSAEP